LHEITLEWELVIDLILKTEKMLVINNFVAFNCSPRRLHLGLKGKITESANEISGVKQITKVDARIPGGLNQQASVRRLVPPLCTPAEIWKTKQSYKCLLIVNNDQI